MSPDESAWWGAVLAALRRSGPRESANDADEALAQLRKRREAGAFGPHVEVCPKCEAPAPLDARHVRERLPNDVFEALVWSEGTWHEAGRPQNTAETRFAQEARRARASEREWEAKWLQATMRAKSAETEVRRLECVVVERATAIHRAERERDEQRARAEAAESLGRTLREEVRVVRDGEVRVESLLKEALGNLRSWRDGGRPFESTVDLIAKAKAAGHEYGL